MNFSENCDEKERKRRRKRANGERGERKIRKEVKENYFRRKEFMCLSHTDRITSYTNNLIGNVCFKVSID